MLQPPGDGHRALALVGDVGGGAEEGVGGSLAAAVFVAAADEGQVLGVALGIACDLCNRFEDGV